MRQDHVSRADLHCHSSASARSHMGVQRAVGLPECATPAEEVYALAKRRGMDFVTITDHDTIDGALLIADRPDVFVSEELTASFAGEPQAAVHILCWGITAEDHEWLQAHALHVERCATYLRQQGIACALAHPYYFVRRALQARHLRALAQLFPVWETRNGSRAPELNAPAVLAAELQGLPGSGGSDDHAGVDVGCTWTQTPPTRTVGEFLEHLRAGTVEPGGAQGDSAVWAHAPLALAARTLGMGQARPPRAQAVLEMLARLLADGQNREGPEAEGLSPQDARDLLVAWVDAVGLDRDAERLVRLLQDEAVGHHGLRRQALRAHEQLLGDAARHVDAELERGTVDNAVGSLARACVPALPYVATTAFLARERGRARPRRDERPGRVALVADALDGIDGVTRTVAELRRHGVPGWNVDVIGTDAMVDRRLATVADVGLPYYPGRTIGVPALPGLAETLANHRYDLVHVCSPGPAGIGAAFVAELLGVPLIISHHTEFARYARLRSGRADVERLVRTGLSMLYRRATVLLSPSSAADRSVAALGVDPARVLRWTRGVDTELFRPRESRPPDERVRVAYSGRLSTEKGIDLLADAFLTAHGRDPRLQLVLAGGGPEEPRLRDALGSRATFLGWLDRDALARSLADADIFCFASRTDTYGQAVLEAQASGLPVVAVAEGGPLDLIQDGHTGLLRPPDSGALSDALVDLAASPERRRELGAAAAVAARTRTWQAALGDLSDAYEHALRARPAGKERRLAA